MAKKKSKRLKLNKKQRQQLHRFGLPALVCVLSLLAGVIGAQVFASRRQPSNIVWATESSVSVPSALRSYLSTRDDCQQYRGAGTPNGVGLWAVFQTSKNHFAKIAYGCSWNLDSYIMAVKTDSGWQLLDPKQYFAPFENTTAAGALPYCTMVDAYQIDKAIEPFCIDAAGAAQANTVE